MTIVTMLIAGIGDAGPRRLRAVADLAALSETLRAAEAAAGPVGGDGESQDWETIFQAVFGGELRRNQERLFDQAGISFPEWNDPNASYGSDAKAWLDAYHGVVDPLLDTIRSWGPADADLAAIAGELHDLGRRASASENGALAAVHIARARAAVETLAAAA